MSTKKGGVLMYPNYGYGFNPYQSQYQQQYQPQVVGQQQQTPQPTFQTSIPTNNQIQSFPGRYVNDFSEISVNEVPMDGKFALFAKTDMSELVAKAWNANGQIVNIVFKPCVEDKTETSTQESQKAEITLSAELSDMLTKRFDDISSQIEKLQGIIKPTRAKKEVASDE